MLFLVSALIQNYGQPFENCIPECRQEIEQACEYMEQHYAERIRLDQLCRHTALSKSTLLRAFTKSKGITPYRYLETLRINKAKKLLGQGISPLNTAIQTGFSDQSHFTNYFSSFIGLAPICTVTPCLSLADSPSCFLSASLPAAAASKTAAAVAVWTGWIRRIFPTFFPQT